MKIMKILYQIILIMMLIIICSSCICYASSADPDLNNVPRPVVSFGSAESILESILGVLTVIGIICVVVVIGLIGFNTILGSAGEKAINQEKLVGLLIAAAIMTGGSSIAQIIMKFAESI